MIFESKCVMMIVMFLNVAMSGVDVMAVSYKKLWKILIDKEMKKQDLQKAASVSWGVITKLSKGETVSMDVLIKICKVLECDIGDVMELLPDEPKEDK